MKKAIEFFCAVVVAASFGPPMIGAKTLPMPDGGAGIGFDDLNYAPKLGRVLVPGGRTGKLFLVDPKSWKIETIAGFSSDPSYAGGHGEGTTSADEGAGLLFGTDRNARTVAAIDPAAGKVSASAPLVGVPDYVRYAAATDEVWVSEPEGERIEIFSVPGMKKTGEIAVPGGPESLVIDPTRGRAYTHLWKKETLAIDLKTRQVAARWPNGCRGSRGIALDEKRGFVFAGCEEGKAAVIDAGKDGKILGALDAGDGVDVIAYDPGSRHLYLPGAKSATMAVLAVSEKGALSLVKTVKTAKGSHCVASDGRGGVWVCDPDKGRLLFFPDGRGK